MYEGTSDKQPDIYFAQPTNKNNKMKSDPHEIQVHPEIRRKIEEILARKRMQKDLCDVWDEDY